MTTILIALDTNATGTVDAQYFFGKPVAGGQVIIKGFVTDVDRFQVFELTGETDEHGFYAYEFQVPDYFVGQLESNTANHAENTEDSVTVAEQVILVEAVAESGFLRPNLENIIYLQTSYPNGRSAQTMLNINTDSLTGTLTDTVTIETDDGHSGSYAPHYGASPQALAAGREAHDVDEHHGDVVHRVGDGSFAPFQAICDGRGQDVEQELF